MSENPNHQQNPASSSRTAAGTRIQHAGRLPPATSRLRDQALAIAADSGCYWSAVWLADFRWRAGSGWRDSGYCCPGEGEERHRFR